MYIYELGRLLQSSDCNIITEFYLKKNQKRSIVYGNVLTNAIIKNGIITEGNTIKYLMKVGILRQSGIEGAVLNEGKSNYKEEEKIVDKLKSDESICQRELSYIEFNGKIEKGILKYGNLKNANCKAGLLSEIDQVTGLMQNRKISGIIKNAKIINGKIKNGVLKEFNVSKGTIEESNNEYVFNNKSLRGAKIEGGEIHDAILEEAFLIREEKTIPEASISKSELKAGKFGYNFTKKVKFEGNLIIESRNERKKNLIKLLFGEMFYEITEPAVNFLFSDNIPTNLIDFQKKFKDLNTKIMRISFDNFIKVHGIEFMSDDAGLIFREFSRNNLGKV